MAHGTTHDAEAAPAAGRRQLNSHESWLKAQDVLRAVKFTHSLKTLRDGDGDVAVEYYDDLVHISILGQGSFGVVEKSMYLPQNRVVAVKRIKFDGKLTESEIQDMKRETALAKKLRSPYIVELLGSGSYVDQFNNNVHFMVQEYMEGGTLKQVVARCMRTKQRLYTMQDALRWLIHVAKGLKYLHESIPMVIHRDMKLENILLNVVDCHTAGAKICDMGLSTLVRPLHTLSDVEKELETSKASQEALHVNPKSTQRRSSAMLSMQWSEHARSRGRKGGDLRVHQPGDKLGGRVGTWLYMAPEVYRKEMYDEKVDVFSFGVVAYELVHRYRMSMAVSSSAEAEQYAQQTAIHDFRPPVDELLPSKMRHLIQDCWHPNPTKRPDMASVVTVLREISQASDWGPYEAADAAAYQDSGCTCCLS